MIADILSMKNGHLCPTFSYCSLYVITLCIPALTSVCFLAIVLAYTISPLKRYSKYAKEAESQGIKAAFSTSSILGFMFFFGVAMFGVAFW